MDVDRGRWSRYHAVVASHPAPTLNWLVVATADQARVFERDARSGALREIAEAVHDACRGTGVAPESGPQDKTHKSAPRTALDPRAPLPHRERGRFARQLSRWLEDAALARRMPGLVLLAPSPFLGTLMAGLGPATQRRLKACAASDLTPYRGLDLERQVSLALRPTSGQGAPAGSGA